jgi:hypothetical protein
MAELNAEGRLTDRPAPERERYQRAILAKLICWTMRKQGIEPPPLADVKKFLEGRS